MAEKVASLTLNMEEAGVLEAALRYYADTIGDGEEDPEQWVTDSIRIAERVRQRLRKSVDRHGYSFKSLA